MRIRKRDGTVVEESDNYILKDGESMLVPLSMMDSARRMVRDSRGNVAGCRPGFLFADGDQGVEDAHREYRDAIEQRWQSDRWQSKPTERAPVRPQTFDSPQAAVDAAHAQYRHDIENRWRR
jgi:hypothetical protein